MDCDTYPKAVQDPATMAGGTRRGSTRTSHGSKARAASVMRSAVTYGAGRAASMRLPNAKLVP